MNHLPAVLALCLSGFGAAALAQQTAFTAIERQTNKEIILRLSVRTGLAYQIETSSDLGRWDPLSTLRGSTLNQYTDSAAPFLNGRFYRALELSGTNVLTGDHLSTAEGDAIVHPINHASFFMSWNGLAIYNDPVGGTAPYQTLPRADLILVSHNHGDHFDTATLNAVKGASAVILAPQAVYNSLPVTLKNQTVVLSNGAKTNVLGIRIEAVPSYTFTTSNHPKGVGNGYVLTLGGKRVYISGDSEDTSEMRQLAEIDVAFVCMNVPYTMSVTKAADAIRAFRPRVVYPYHYRNQDSTLADLNSLKRQMGIDLQIEIRTRKWY